MCKGGGKFALTARDNRRTRQQQALPYLVNGSLERGHSNKWGAALNLTLRFGESPLQFKTKWLTLVDVTVAVRSAYLNWTLIDCRLPEEDWMFNPQVPHVVTIERETTRSTEIEADSTTTKKSGGATAIEVKPSIFPSARLGAASGKGASRRSRQTTGQTIKDTYKKETCTITARGNATLPSWQIEAPPGHDVMRGTVLDNQRFARADITGEDASDLLNLKFQNMATL